MEFLTVQFVNFLAAVGIGFCLGLFFDLYRAITISLRLTSKFLPLRDLVWWFLATSLVFFVLVGLNWGELRLYIFLGQIIGIILYFKRVSPYCLRNIIHSLSLLKIIIRRLLQLIAIPLRLLKTIIIWPFFLISLLTGKTFLLIRKNKNKTRASSLGVLKKFRTGCKKILSRIFIKSSRIKK